MASSSSSSMASENPALPEFVRRTDPRRIYSSLNLMQTLMNIRAGNTINYNATLRNGMVDMNQDPERVISSIGVSEMLQTEGYFFAMSMYRGMLRKRTTRTGRWKRGGDPIPIKRERGTGEPEVIGHKRRYIFTLNEDDIGTKRSSSLEIPATKCTYSLHEFLTMDDIKEEKKHTPLMLLYRIMPYMVEEDDLATVSSEIAQEPRHQHVPAQSQVDMAAVVPHVQEVMSICVDDYGILSESEVQETLSFISGSDFPEIL